MVVRCPYCGVEAELVKPSDKAYPHAEAYGPIYLCEPCQAWVGCHRSTGAPLGSLANAELRRLRQRAHRAFDPLWEGKMRRDDCTKATARAKGYAWLATQLDLPLSQMHIGQMGPVQCQRIIELCLSVANKRSLLKQRRAYLRHDEDD